jgi:hypothetical protein
VLRQEDIENWVKPLSERAWKLEHLPKYYIRKQGSPELVLFKRFKFKSEATIAAWVLEALKAMEEHNVRLLLLLLSTLATQTSLRS